MNYLFCTFSPLIVARELWTWLRSVRRCNKTVTIWLHAFMDTKITHTNCNWVECSMTTTMRQLLAAPLTAFSIIIHICLLYSLLASLSCYCCRHCHRHRHNRQLNVHEWSRWRWKCIRCSSLTECKQSAFRHVAKRLYEWLTLWCNLRLPRFMFMENVHARWLCYANSFRNV